MGLGLFLPYGSRNGPQGICFGKKQLYPLRHHALLAHISIWKPAIS